MSDGDAFMELVNGPTPSREAALEKALRAFVDYHAGMHPQFCDCDLLDIAAAALTVTTDCDFCGAAIPDPAYDEHRRSHHFKPAPWKVECDCTADDHAPLGVCATCNHREHGAPGCEGYRP